jgi:hypothetical protein
MTAPGCALRDRKANRSKLLKTNETQLFSYPSGVTRLAESEVSAMLHS